MICAPPSALACLPTAGGSFSWMGCYQSTPLVNSAKLSGIYSSTAQCIKDCSDASSSYIYASISDKSCYCGDSSSSPTSSPIDSSKCNILCSGDNTLCGGYDGSFTYSEAYTYTLGGTPECPAIVMSSSTAMGTSTASSVPSSAPSSVSSLAPSSAPSSLPPVIALSSLTSTTLKTSTTTAPMASSKTSTLSATRPTGTSCDYLVNGKFESGNLAPWTVNLPAQAAIVKPPIAGVPGVTPFSPSEYVLQATLVGGETFSVQQTVPVCSLVNYAPLISYQLAVDPAKGKKSPLSCTYQFCELISGNCGRVATLRAGKWGSNTPQWFTKVTQTMATVQVNFHCPGPAVVYMGQLLMNPFQHG